MEFLMQKVAYLIRNHVINAKSSICVRTLVIWNFSKIIEKNYIIANAKFIEKGGLEPSLRKRKKLLLKLLEAMLKA